MEFKFNENIIINEKKSEDENLDITLIQLAKAMIDLFKAQRNKNKNSYKQL